MPTKQQVTKQKQKKQQAGAKAPAAQLKAYNDEEMSDAESEQKNTS